MNRKVLIALGAILIVAAGALYYFKFRPASAQAQPDPAIQISIALGALERSESHRLTTDQIQKILPLLRVLRDTHPGDVEASRSLAQAIRAELTSDQLAEIERLRTEAQARRDQGSDQQPPPRRRNPGGPGPGFGPGPGGPTIIGPGPGGPGGPAGPGVGPGGATPQSRAEVRARARQALLSRLIRFLERRLQE